MRGLFLGLTTLDCIYRAPQAPQANQKLVADAMTIAAGGPATNAAVTFSAVGGQATLLAAVGQHPLSSLITQDLDQAGVILADLSPQRQASPPVSSIVVTAATGERAVISRNAVGLQVADYQELERQITEADILLLDGHQMTLGVQAAQLARSLGVPVVVDAGSWKPGFDSILSQATAVIASANFRSPNGMPTLKYCQHLGVAHGAVTHGGDAINFYTGDRQGQLAVPTIEPVDTLGAGDIFHGAFCHSWTGDFAAALMRAAQVAAHSCRYFGTRAWIQSWQAGQD